MFFRGIQFYSCVANSKIFSLFVFLGTELKKLTSESKESLTPTKMSEVKELKSRFC